MYGMNEESKIVWITDLEQLESKYSFNGGSKSFIFARYVVIDRTCNKTLKKFMSRRKADEKVQKQLAYKKHANCTVDVVEENILSKLDIDFSNVLGSESNSARWANNFYEPRRTDNGFFKPTLRSLITLESNISMVAEIKEIELDKNIITKKEEQMRLTKLVLKDINNNVVSLTLFNCAIADDLKVGTRVQLTDAQVNFRKDQNTRYDEKGIPDGIVVPRWGSISIFTNEWIKQEMVQNIMSEPIILITKKVNCEQEHCAVCGQDRQYFCFKCNKELCSVCIFEHRKNTSISGLECDNEILFGSRSDNT